MMVVPQHKVEAIFDLLLKKTPDPKTELNYINPFTLLVAVLLSAQATDVGVNKATEALFKKVDTPKKMCELGLDELKNYVKTINYYPTKAKNIIALSQRLCDHFQGQVPERREDLESLPGVGRKTANVVLHVAFGQNTIPVDTHIMRVSQRLELSKNSDPTKIEHDLYQIIPERYLDKAHHLLVLHGRYVCKAQNPLCGECVLRDLCPFPGKIN